MGPSDEVIVGVPQLSVAVAAPGAGTPVGLQPRLEPGGQNVNTGGVTSTVQVSTWVQEAVLPQPSVAMYTRVSVRLQPVTTMSTGGMVIVGVPQTSVATAIPGSGMEVGLHPRF